MLKSFKAAFKDHEVWLHNTTSPVIQKYRLIYAIPNKNLECWSLGMPSYVILCSTLLFITLPKAFQSHLDGSNGLKRRGNVRGGNQISYGNFAVDKFHRLQVSIGSTTEVSNYTECALSCVDNPPCSSFNVALSPHSDGKYLCELLNEDKYSANLGQLVSSQGYHHYSIKVFQKSYWSFLTIS